MNHRGSKVGLKKKTKTTFSKMQEPYTRDRQLVERAEIMSSKSDLRYNQSSKSRKPVIPQHKKDQEQEIIEKETKK